MGRETQRSPCGTKGRDLPQLRRRPTEEQRGRPSPRMARCGVQQRGPQEGPPGNQTMYAVASAHNNSQSTVYKLQAGRYGSNRLDSACVWHNNVLDSSSSWVKICTSLELSVFKGSNLYIASAQRPCEHTLSLIQTQTVVYVLNN